MTNALPQHALRRLQRYRGRLEGAQMAQQQAEGLTRTLFEQYEAALRSACEDHDVPLPREGIAARIDIDWNNGEVTWEIAPVVAPLNGRDT
jgi:hypothetical protein